MKIRSQLFTAGLLIALAVPATSNAAYTSVHSGHHATSTTSKSAVKASSTAKTTAPVAPIFIHVPVSAPAPIVESQLEQCQTQGIGCTDQQFCSFWQINCASLTSSSDTPDVSSGDASASSDSASYTDSYDQLLTLENEDCCDPSSCMSLVS